MSEETKLPAEPEKPKRQRTPRKTSLKDWLEKHPLPTICGIAIVCFISGVGASQWVWEQVQKPKYEQETQEQTKAVAEATTKANSYSIRLSALETTQKENEKTIATLEGTIRNLEQNLNLVTEQERITKANLAEMTQSKQALDKLVLEQLAKTSSLKEQTEDLKSKLASFDGTRLTKQELEALLSQADKQRSIFADHAYVTWRNWRNTGSFYAGAEASKICGRLQKETNLENALKDATLIIVNFGELLQFTDYSALIYAQLRGLIDKEITQRTVELAFHPEESRNPAKAIATELPIVNEWRQMLKDAPEMGEKTTQEWLKNVLELQKSFYAKLGTEPKTPNDKKPIQAPPP